MLSFKTSLLLALTLVLGHATAGDYFDVLDQPARQSALAPRSPLIAATRAGERLVLAGQRGHILFSDDAGRHWQQAVVPVSADLNAVTFPAPSHGWAVGNDGVVLHSDDAGSTWRKQLDGRQIGALLVEHYTALARAEPGNERWDQLAEEGRRLAREGADKPLLDVWFANERVGYVVGVFNLILRTDDGGEHWTPFLDRTDNPDGLHLNAIASTGDGLYIVGEQGLLLKWDEATQRFAALHSPYQGSFFGVVGKPGEVLVYGLRGHVLRSLDGGASWTTVQTGLQVSLTAATLDRDGDFRLFSQAGHMLLCGQAHGALAQPVVQRDPSPIAGAVQASDGSLIVVGSRGVRTISEE